MTEKNKERLFEFAMVLVGLIGLLILFTILFNGPSFIIRHTLDFFNIKL